MMQGKKISYDRDDVFSSFDQIQELAHNMAEKSFNELYRQHIPYKNSSYDGTMEKRDVIQMMDKWISGAFTVVGKNVEDAHNTAFLSERTNDELLEKVKEAEEEVENSIEKLIHRKVETVQFYLSTQQDERTQDEFVLADEDKENEKEEEIENNIPELPKLKRPLEEVKEDYAKTFALLDRYNEELSSKRNKLESYQHLAKQVMENNK